jgi:hypothetical protein
MGLGKGKIALSLVPEKKWVKENSEMLKMGQNPSN